MTASESFWPANWSDSGAKQVRPIYRHKYNTDSKGRQAII